MMTMLDRANAIETKMGLIAIARKTTNQRAAIQTRVQEWNLRLASITSLRTKHSWLGSTQAPQSKFVDEFPAVVALSAEARKRFAEGEGVEALAEGSLWTRLINATDAAIKTMEETLQSGWRQFVDGHGVIETPATLRGRLPQSPGNKQAMTGYDAQHATYARLANQKVPRSADDPQTLATAIGVLRQTFAGFQFDVPPDVEVFYKAVDAGGAGLNLLTREVLDWLQVNGQTDRYVVRGNAT